MSRISLQSCFSLDHHPTLYRCKVHSYMECLLIHTSLTTIPNRKLKNSNATPITDWEMGISQVTYAKWFSLPIGLYHLVVMNIIKDLNTIISLIQGCVSHCAISCELRAGYAKHRTILGIYRYDNFLYQSVLQINIKIWGSPTVSINYAFYIAPVIGISGEACQ